MTPVYSTLTVTPFSRIFPCADTSLLRCMPIKVVQVLALQATLGACLYSNNMVQ